MDRREFLKRTAAAGIGLGLAGRAGWFPDARPARADEAVPTPAAGGGDAPRDLVAVRNGEPEAMFDRGIAAMGGMGRFVQKGQRVLIKPNASFGQAPEYSTDTHPALVERVIRHCLDAGAARVVLLDHTLSRKGEVACFNDSGIAEAIRKGGGVRAPADADRYYQAVDVAGVRLKQTRVHEAVLEADVLIDLPVLKNHGGAAISAGMKNLMGLIWDRRYYHGNDIHQCIADFLHARKPDLTVIDAYRTLVSNGPRGGSPDDARLTKMQIISTDIVAADAAGARLFGHDPANIGHVRIAHDAGFGEIDAARLATRTITLYRPVG